MSALLEGCGHMNLDLQTQPHNPPASGATRPKRSRRRTRSGKWWSTAHGPPPRRSRLWLRLHVADPGGAPGATGASAPGERGNAERTRRPDAVGRVGQSGFTGVPETVLSCRPAGDLRRNQNGTPRQHLLRGQPRRRRQAPNSRGAEGRALQYIREHRDEMRELGKSS